MTVVWTGQVKMPLSWTETSNLGQWTYDFNIIIWFQKEEPWTIMYIIWFATFFQEVLCSPRKSWAF